MSVFNFSSLLKQKVSAAEIEVQQKFVDESNAFIEPSVFLTEINTLGKLIQRKSENIL
jgi:hypothetical protein